MKIDVKNTIKTVENDFRITMSLLKLTFGVKSFKNKSNEYEKKQAKLVYVKERLAKIDAVLKPKNFVPILRCNGIIALSLYMANLKNPEVRDSLYFKHCFVIMALAGVVIARTHMDEYREQKFSRDLKLLRDGKSIKTIDLRKYKNKRKVKILIKKAKTFFIKSKNFFK